jgi:ABC-type transport system involved in multi-copper enzyme maturation permease subunit
LTSLVCVWIEAADRANLGAEYFDTKREVLEKATGDPSFAAYLARSPSSLLAFLKVTIWLTPLLVALLGFDSISGELQQRTVRFWTIRTRRWSIFTGKLLGLWTLVALVTLALNLVAGTVALARGYVTLGELLVWGARFWFVTLVIVGAWSAIATFVSSCFRTPIVALLTTFAVFFLLWLAGISGFIERKKDALTAHVFKDMSWYEYFYPNAYDGLLLSPQATKVFTALGILMAFVALTAACGSALFERKDL